MKKSFLLITLLISSIYILTAQSKEEAIDWVFNTGGNGDFVHRLNYNSKGDLIILGAIGTNGNFGTINLKGNPVRYLGKRTQNGEMTILATFNSYKNISAPYVIVPYDMAVDSEDNIIVSGNLTYFEGSYNFGNGVTLSEKGFFIVKYNADGIAQWAKSYNMGYTFTSTTSPKQLQILPNKDIYFAIHNPNAVLNPNGTSVPFRYNYPFWLIKMDESGNELWHKELVTGSLRDITGSANNFIADNEGNTHLFFAAYTYTNIIVGADTLKGARLLSFDTDGNLRKNRSVGGNIRDFAVEKETGNIIFSYATILTTPTNELLPNPPNGYEGYVATDSNYIYIKSSVKKPKLENRVANIYPLGNLSFVRAENYYPSDIIETASQTYTATKNVVAIKFFDENLEFSHFIAHPEMSNLSDDDINKSLAVFNKKIAFSSVFINPTIVNGNTLTPYFINGSGTLGDMFVAQADINQVVLAVEKDAKESSISLYPNPTDQEINIEINENFEQAELLISNANGKEFFHSSFNQSHTRVDVSHLPKGIYIAQISVNGKTETQKIIIK